MRKNFWASFGVWLWVGWFLFNACHTALLRADELASPAEQEELKTIEALFSGSEIENTQTHANHFIRTFPRSPLLPSVENIRGLIFLKQKQAAQAIQAFSHALDLSATQGFRQYLLYNLASAQLEGRAYNEADESLKQIHPELLDPPTRLKVISLQVLIYERTRAPQEALRYLSQFTKTQTDPENSEQAALATHLTQQVLQSINEIPTLEPLLENPENERLKDVILFRLAQLSAAKGDSALAITRLKRLMGDFPNSSLLSSARDTLSQLQQNASVDQNTIGILLPLKGRMAKFGLKTLQGILLAFDTFKKASHPSPFKLILEDAGDEPETAIQALNRLVNQHHVVAVIGPMISKGIDQVSQRAQELSVPLISLTRRSGPVSQEYVFHAGATPQMQTHALARHAIENLGIKKFAILHPSDKLGNDFSQAFWDAVDALGGEIVGFESYTPVETDFRTPIDKLSGLFYTEARQKELEALAQLRAENRITKKTRKTESFFSLKPIVDYQAVFIPDEPKKLGQIMPTFSYRDVEGIKFLGTSEWNSPEFLSRSENYGERSFFADSFLAEAANGTAKRFVEDFRATFDSDPTSLEAIAYDAGTILKSLLLARSSGTTRAQLKDQLTQLQNFSGVTGKISYKEGQLFRQLKVFSIRAGKIRDVSG